MRTIRLGDKKVSLARIALLGKARIEKNFQKKLESMQLAVLNGEVSLGKEAQKAQKELDAIKKIRLSLKSFQQMPISNFTALKALYDLSLKSITLESLASEYAIQAAEFKAKALEPLSDEQSTVVDRFYGIKARKDWGIISQVAAILDLNAGVIAKDVVAQTTAQEKELQLQGE